MHARGSSPSRFADRDESRGDWMELFFDLVFVALIGQLAQGLRTDPSFAGILVLSLIHI